MARVAKRQQRLWSEDDTESESEPKNAAGKRKWMLDAETKRVGRAGLAAARERLRRNRK